jgi:hypothetical protein
MLKANVIRLILLLNTTIGAVFLSVTQVQALGGDVHARSLNISGLGWAYWIRIP